MYRAFNLTELENFDELRKIDQEKAREDYNLKKNELTSKISLPKILSEATIAVTKDNQIRIDADEIQRNVFPNYKDYDVFLSHSHKDIELVQKFAYYLRHELKLKVFLDSEAWGYVYDLLKTVDDAFALKDDGSYDIEKSRIDANNIFLMLSNAIHDVMNETDLVFFVNTSNSVNFGENIRTDKALVESPWIYDELKTASIIKPKIPSYVQGMIAVFKDLNEWEYINDSAETIWVRDATKDINSLAILNNDTLYRWKHEFDQARFASATGIFYRILFKRI